MARGKAARKAAQKIFKEATESVTKSVDNLADDAVKKAARVIDDIEINAAKDLTNGLESVSAAEQKNRIYSGVTKGPKSARESANVFKNQENSYDRSAAEEVFNSTESKAQSIEIDQEIKKRNDQEQLKDELRKKQQKRQEDQAKQQVSSVNTSGRAKSMEEYIARKKAPLLEEESEVLKTFAGGKAEDIEKIRKNLGLGEGDELKAESIKGYYKGKRDAIDNNKLGNYMGYHQVPQKAAALGGTAWLVSKMSAAGGRQSNAELYGQATPYGGGM